MKEFIQASNHGIHSISLGNRCTVLFRKMLLYSSNASF